MTEPDQYPEFRAMRLRTGMLAFEADVRVCRECQRLGIDYDAAMSGSPMGLIAERYAQFGIYPRHE